MTDGSVQPADHAQPTRKVRIGLGGGALVVIFVIVAALSRRFGGHPAGGPIDVRPGALSGWNVLLVSIDTVRADRLGCYGYPGGTTPALDALAAAGVRCDQAIAPVPLTLPSHASLLTGLDPPHHGARINGVFRLGDDVVTLAERLKRAGYRTAAVISAYVLDRRFGLAQGFDSYADDLTEGTKPMKFGFRERTAAQANAAAIRWLRGNKDERFFLWVHYFDPHAPYQAPEPYRSRFAGRDYDGEIAYADEHLGRLLAVLDEFGLRSRTLVVVVSDHGESLGEHRELTHGIMIYDATLRVPVIMHAEGILQAGLVVRRQVGLIDITPTVLDLLGVDLPDELDGMSLLRPWPAEARELYIESLGPQLQHGWAPLMGLRRNDLKFIRAPRSELYDLRADPNELNNILAERRQVAEQFHERLRAVLGGDPHLAAAVTGNLPLDAETRDKLAGIGYVFDVGQAPATQRAMPDPKDVIDDWRLLRRAQTLADRGEHAKTVSLLEPHLKKRPNDVRALQTLAGSYRAVGRRDRALAAFRREVELAYRKVEARVGIGSILLEMGKIAEAEAEFRRALAEDPQSQRAVFGLGTVLVRQNRLADALKRFEQCIEMGRGSDTASAHFNLGAIHHAAGRRAQARQAFERSLATDPGFARAARALAELKRQAGQRQQAIELLRRTLARRVDPEALAALAEMLAEAGQLQPAAQALRQSLELRPDLTAGHYQLALVLQRLGEPDQALHHLQACVRLSPSHVQARFRLSVMLAGRKRFAEAETHIREALKLAPKWAVGHYNLGVLLANQDKLPEAIEAFRRAIDLDRRYAGAHNALGQALFSSGRTDEAAMHFREALKIDPNLAAARENLQRCTTQPTTTPSSPTTTRSSPTTSRFGAKRVR